MTHEPALRRLAPRLARASAFALLLALGLAPSGCREAAAEPPVAAAAEAPRAVSFEAAVARATPRVIELSGELSADETSEVAASRGGVVTSVLVDVGSRVKQGDLLVTVDAREAELRVAEAHAAIEQARARLGLAPGSRFDATAVPDVVAATQAMELAASEADRARRLVDTGALSDAAWDQARSAAARATAQRDAALGAARQTYAAMGAAGSQARLAQKAVADTSIRAPFDGAVVERRITKGEYAQPGRVVAVVVRDGTLRLRFDVPESEVAAAQVGRPVSIEVAAYPGRVFEAKIARISASLRDRGRTLPVEADVENTDGTLRPGFFARVALGVAGSERPAIFVPASAIGSSGSASRVFVHQGGELVERVVKVGRRDGGLVEIEGAIAAGDLVAVTDLDALRDGDAVAPGR